MPYYLLSYVPMQFDNSFVGKSSSGKYLIMDCSHTPSDGTVNEGAFIVLEIVKLNATEMYLKGDTGYMRKYKPKQK